MNVRALLVSLAGTVSFTALGVQLANDGQAVLPIVLSDKASPRVKASADELADLLSRMSGAKFQIETGDGSKGIVLGLARDFPSLPKDERILSTALTDRENYLIRSNDQYLIMLGATDLAVEDAVADLTHQLGVRQFFPGKHWEIIPKRTDLRIDINRFQRPAYFSRTIWFGYGVIPERKADYETWCRRNRAVKGIELLSGHAYDAILLHRKADFAAHPEWLALVDGKRQGNKFCISNPELRKLVVEESLKRFTTDPASDSVSVEPSDGGGWCECKQCAKIGSVSDQALFLSNEVARAVSAKRPGKLVGQYAYNEHSPAPMISTEDNVVVSIAAGFIKGGFTMDQLLEGWSSKASTLGIREYLSVMPWDHDMPGKARGARLDYLLETIPHFHEKGARYYTAESSDNWGCNGLGYYLASRLLWDPEQASNGEALFDDFLDSAFGPAKLPMTRFYKLINRSQPPESDDLIGRMYRFLKDAGDNEIDDEVRSRIDDLVLYTRACEHYMDYSAAKGKDRQAALESMLRFAWRMRSSGMTHVMGLWRYSIRDKSISIPKECAWQSPAGKNPWKIGAEISRDEIDSFIEQGIERRQIADFESETFSNELVPATPLKLTTDKPGTFGTLQRGVGNYWTWIEKAPATIRLKVSAGLIYQTSGPAKIRLFPTAETQGLSVSDMEIAPDKQVHAVELTTTFTGLHRIEVDDRRAGTSIVFPAGLARTFEARADQTATINGRHTLYFYVPKGAGMVGGYADGPGYLVNGSGKRVHEFTGKPGYFKSVVETGEDGRLWKFDFTSGNRVLLTVPPQMAASSSELLLPREIVERDAK